MAHRALLAYERDDGTYDLHRSRWGGADFSLARRITAETPFAGDAAAAVDPEPVASGLSLDEIVAEHVDFLHHEAFFRVDREFAATPFHVLWFGFELDAETVERSETVGHGALVAAHVRNPGGVDDYLRGWVRGTKAVVGDAVDRGWLSRADAVEYLAERVAAWDDDREVIRPE
ncbi:MULTISPECIES: DUF6735 family protein [Halorussus]|uniref:DUF6735 family protein n=1 Tax=Halorussus TaxID=1070314 RepID=UPI0020A19228|nr:DUF6735 family protein [Halorussus vallis]USZ74842.1 hypothetical protein NGM07_15535 [Halorussus vallis]